MLTSVEAVKVTSRNALVYSTVTPKLRLQGEGFAGDGTNIHLTFVPALDPSMACASAGDVSFSVAQGFGDVAAGRAVGVVCI